MLPVLSPPADGRLLSVSMPVQRVNACLGYGLSGSLGAWQDLDLLKGGSGPTALQLLAAAAGPNTHECTSKQTVSMGSA